MNKIWIALLLCFCISGTAFAQNTIFGSVVDTTDTPLPSATVMVLRTADSSLISFALTDGQGAFKVQRVPKGTHILRVTYIGYANLDQKITFEEAKSERQMGVLKLLPESALIDEVTVTGERNPIEIKEDTVEFNAASFRTQPNAVVEDLLKQLPGVEVERDGAVKAQGEDVQRVLVDGKEFFGRDPKIATKNLPADAVDKVQVFDQKSDQTQFTGIDDGQREKTINLTLKEDKKKGAFGNVTAGYGDAGRFVGRATINSFNKNTQLSLIGTGNNINEQGFSLDDYQSFSSNSGGGGFRFRRGGGDSNIPINFGNNEGIATTYALGLNLNHEFSDVTELNASYFYSRFDKLTQTSTFTQTFLSDDRGILSDEIIEQDDLNNNHALNLRFESELDSMSSVIFRGTFGYNETESIGSLASISNQLNGDPGNASDQMTDNNGNVLRGNGNLLYRRKFQKAGRNFSVNLTYGLNNNDFLGNTTSLNTFYTDGNNFFTDDLVQDFDQLNDVNSYSAKATFTEPLGKRRYLEFNYQYSKNQTDVDREVYDVSTGERIFDEALSNLYRVGYTYNNAGINFVVNRPTFNLTVGATVQNSNLDGELLLADTKITQDLTNILPKLNYKYSFTSTKNLTIDYSTNVIEPTITQLQPIVDNSNPLNIYVGNPDLRPEFRHNVRMRFFSFNPGTFTNFFGNMTFTYSANKIRNTQIIDERLITTTTPVNVDSDYRINMYLNYGSRVNSLQFRYNISPSVTYSRGITFINAVENNTDNINTRIRLRFDNLKKEKIDIGFGASYAYNTSQFSIAEDRNQDNFNQNYFTDLTVTISEKFNISSELDYDIFTGLSDDFNQQIPIWNAEISLFMLKGNKGQLKVGVYDILNQNRGISRIQQFNYTIDRQVNALGRYFLTTFTYSLKGFKSDGNRGRSYRYRR